jgi:hypothetical protein
MRTGGLRTDRQSVHPGATKTSRPAMKICRSGAEAAWETWYEAFGIGKKELKIKRFLD